MPITKASGNSVTAAAKGDLVVGNATNDSGVLSVGANDTVLTADSSTATGLKWGTVAAGANWSVINSGGTTLSGTSTTVSGITSADKILVLVDAALLNNNTGAVIGLRLNSDTGNNYAFMGARNYPNSTSFQAQREVYAYALFSGCNSSGLKAFNSAGGCAVGYSSQAYQQQRIHGGWYSGSSTISSITIFAGSGSFTGGKVYVYKSA